MSNIFGIFKSAKVTRTEHSTGNGFCEMNSKKFIREGITQRWWCWCNNHITSKYL